MKRENWHQHIEDILANLPVQPGVYLMKDEDGQIIYVGKAIVLKNRVKSYFRGNQHTAKVSAMVQKIRDIDYIVTDSEVEALVLECNLIKQHRPFYNILMKDDKSYPFIRINLNDPYPIVEVTHRVMADGAQYFGPFLAAGTLTDTLNAIGENFTLRTCKKDLIRAQQRGERPCLNYQIGRCKAPCAGHITQEEYRRMVMRVVDLLRGKDTGVIKALQQEMKEKSEALEYEAAAELRDRIRQLSRVLERQRATVAALVERDIFSIAESHGEAVVYLLMVRDGKTVGNRYFTLENTAELAEEERWETLVSAIEQYYAEAPFIAREILLPQRPAMREEDIHRLHVLEDWLSEKKGRRVHVLMPQRGEKRALVELCDKNARETLLKREALRRREYERGLGALVQLQEVLGLPTLPRRLECYDISHTQGTHTVASMVVFTDGKPDKNAYRRFRIKTVEGIDDFKSMAEVLRRRLLRAMEPDEKSVRAFGALPDLLVIDGGKGQLSSAVAVEEELGFCIPAMGLAKREEEIFVPGCSESILLPRNSPALHLLTAIRDEAHRFAITYHRSLRASAALQSEINEIAGIGKIRRRALLTEYKTVEAISAASEQELAALPNMTTTAARAVYEHFHRDQTQEEG